MKAAVYEGPGRITIETVDDPVCGPNDVVIEVEACGICGTDVSAFKHPSLFAAPGQVIGHEFAGRVVEVGSALDAVTVSERITAWPGTHCDCCPRCVEGNWNLCERAWEQEIPGAFAQYRRIPNARLNRTIYKLPDAVSWQAGAMVEPLSVALAATARAGIRPTDTVVVMGLGTVGLGVVQTAVASGAALVIAIDRSPLRLAMAAQLGAQVTLDAGTNVVEQVTELVGKGPFGSTRVDTIFECTGVPAALSTAVDMVRVGGQLVVIGLYAESPTLDMNGVIMKQLRMLGSFAYLTEFSSVIELLAAGRLHADRMVSHTFALDQIAEAFETQADPMKSVKVMVEPSSSATGT